MSTTFTTARGFKALLLAGSVSAIALSTPAFAQDEGASESDDNPIIVTGSRIQRKDFEANSPIVTIDDKFLKQTGSAALEQSLNKLPQFVPAKTPTGGGDIQPTATNTPGSATISLRGLGSNRTLVLLDGRRATPSNASMVVDITTIPSAAIERVETISGGASATYGADAVAGVTNFVLKKNFQGLELDGQASISQHGDGFEYQLSGIMGADFDDGRGNVSFAMSTNVREASFQRDRSWYRDVWADPSIGGSGFFIDAPGVAVTGVPASAFFGPGNPFANATPGDPTPPQLRPDPGLNPDLASSYSCVAQPAATVIDSGICVPVNFGAPGSPIVGNVLYGLQAFTVYANPDGTAFTGTGFAQRGGAYKYGGTLDGFNHKLTDAGTIATNDTYLYLNLPLTRYNMFARGNYEINDWIGVFAQGLYSHVSTKTVNEGGPIVGGWSVSVPYGPGIYHGNANYGYADSVTTTEDPNNPGHFFTNSAYTAGGQYGLNCPTLDGCSKDVVFPLPGEIADLMDARTNPNADVSLNYLFPEPRETFTDVSTYNLLAGFEGYIPGTDWTWELFVNHGVSETYAKQTGVYSLSRLRAVMNSPNWGTGFSANSNPGGGGFGAGYATCTSGLNIFTQDYLTDVSDDCKNAIRADLKNRSMIRQTIVQGNLQGKLLDLPAGELRAAVGASYQEVQFDFTNDTLTSQGSSFQDQALGIYPSGDSHGYIETKEVYGELLVPVLSDIPGIKLFNLELGGRISHYNTTGTSYTYKALGDWEVTDWLRIRGGFNRAERAPNIGELFLSPQQTFGVNTLGDICSERATFRISAAASPDIKATCSALMDLTAGDGSGAAYYGQPVAQQPGPGVGFAFPTLVGNANLVPEVAKTWTAGVVIQAPGTSDLLSRLRLSIDWYNIKIAKAIGFSVASTLQTCLDPVYNPLVTGAASSGAAAIAAASAAQCSGFKYQPGPFPGSAPGIGNITMTYTNDGAVDVSGIDAQVDWSIDVGPGQLTLQEVFSYYLHYKSTNLASNPLVEYAGTFGTGDNGLNPGSFRYRSLATLGYGMDNWNINLQWQYLPSVEDSTEAIFPTATTGAPAYSLFSLNGNYAVADNLNIRFGVENLLNKAPPLTGVNPSNNAPTVNGNLPGGAINAGYYDTFGRSFYIGANVKF